MRVIVTGASGLVGRAAVKRFGAIALTHADLDITDAKAVQRSVGNTDLVINCAVIGVDACEGDPALARAVNVDGPANLARAAKSLLHFSSNYVFDGETEKFYAIEDEARPVNEYGRTKLAGEREVLRINPRSFVVRSSWIFGPGKPSFISTVHEKLRAGERVHAVADVWASTTYVDDLVEAVSRIVEQRRFGLHHVVNAGVCSNETFAREAARIVGADPSLVVPASTREMHRAPRPRYTPLAMSQPLRDWRIALEGSIRRSDGKDELRAGGLLLDEPRDE
ncbi:MAG TPA: NAD(P)-dependent oxidoreductase [Thermoanaerobaculia bacterium]|nr:NAD(P)-dependent oxidoreductase [Thermoanaerobaculia bacterium]